MAVLSGIVTSVSSTVDAAVANNIQSAQILISFGTTIITASLIGYKIHSATKATYWSTSKERFKHAMTVVIESAAIYAVVILVYAVYAIRVSFAGVGSVLWNSSYYVEPISIVVAVSHSFDNPDTVH